MKQYEPIAPEHGVIACWTHGSGRSTDHTSIETALRAPGPWRWIHLDANRPATRDWIANHAGEDEAVPEILLAENTRPRCEYTPDRVIFVGRGVNLNPEAQPEDMVSLRAWLTRDRLITVVLRRVRASEDVLEELERRDLEPESAADILARINRRLYDRLAPTVAAISEQLDEFSANIIDEGIEVTTADLVPLRSRTIVLNRYLTPLSVEMDELAGAPCPFLDAGFRASTSDTADRIKRSSEDLTAILARAAVARDEIVSQSSEKLNRRVYALTVLAAIFLPLTVLTGALGMNVGGVPLAEHEHGFVITVAVLLVLVGAELIVFRKLRWL